jgi:hypothetical protein
MSISDKGMFEMVTLDDMWEDLNLSRTLPMAILGVDLAFGGGELTGSILDFGGEVVGGVGESFTNLTS